MTLPTVILGKDAKMCIGTSGTATTEVIGVENLKISYTFDKETKMYLNTSAKTNIPILPDFSITGQVTIDSAGDVGQGILKTAVKNMTNVSFMIYPGTATATTTTYMCTNGYVTEWSPSIEGLKSNVVSFKIEPNGVAMTLPA
jgi:hypothetical protein